MPQTIPKASAAPVGTDRAARYQPGALSFAANVTAGYLRAGSALESASYLRRTLRHGERLGRESARRRELALPCGPRVELRAGDDVGELTHRRVPQAAELRAHDFVAPEPVGRHADVGRDAGHRVGLQAEVRDPERVDHVLAVDVELHGLVLRQPELVALQVPHAGV